MGRGGREAEAQEIMEIFLNTTSSSDIMLSDKSIKYRKIPKISPGAYIFQRPFLRGLFLEGLIFGGAYIRRGLSAEGNLHLQIDWANLIVQSKCTVFALIVLLCIGGQFSKYKTLGGLYWKSDLREGFVNHRFGGLIFGGACTWRGMFSKFYEN